MVYMTKYGIVYHSSVCKDNWSNIIVVQKYRKPNGDLIDRPKELKMQRAAIKSLKAVEDKLGQQVKTTGSWRSCSEQWALYRSDSSRFAHPNTTLHTQGLAIDVNMVWRGELTNAEVNRFEDLMRKHGWKQARPDDEPWHWSFKLKA